MSDKNETPQTAPATPRSPAEMPFDYATTHPHWLRNALVGLSQCGVVDLHWEIDNCGCSEDEPRGEWEMWVETAGGKRIKAKDSDIERLLWFVTLHVEHADDEAFRAQESARAVALAKLSPEERKL